MGNCCNREISVRKFSVRSYERGSGYLFTKSLSKLISSTHTHSPIDLIHSHSDTPIFMSTRTHKPKWPGQDHLCLTQRSRDANCQALTTCPGLPLTGDNKVVSGQIFHIP